MTTWIGIDPGREGAYAILTEHGAFVLDLPWIGKDLDIGLIKRWLPSGEVRAAIEQSQPMPRQGAVSAHTTGYGMGMLVGLFLGMGIPFETVRPAIWKKAMGIPPKSDKGASVQLARRLFPAANLVTPRGRLLDGRAEALLLAEWIRRRTGQ
ncbi:MAG TPA: hypothetical protein VJP78_09715 [Thermoleophilia bacterium]|nr:hypothetical protein [Thermoleophilia bacterium]